MSAATVNDLVFGVSSDAARRMSAAIGRPVQTVVIAIDVCGERNNIAVGAHNLPRDVLIAVLEGAFKAMRDGNCTTQVRVDGEVVARYEGKPS